MKGQFFVHVSADPQNPTQRNVRRGQIIGHVGTDHWLLKFQARGYTFNSVVPTTDLPQFALFDTAQDQSCFLLENFPPPPEAPAETSSAACASTPATQATQEQANTPLFD